jgi:hypothetical protein
MFGDFSDRQRMILVLVLPTILTVRICVRRMYFNGGRHFESDKSREVGLKVIETYTWLMSG